MEGLIWSQSLSYLIKISIKLHDKFVNIVGMSEDVYVIRIYMHGEVNNLDCQENRCCIIETKVVPKLTHGRVRK